MTVHNDSNRPQRVDTVALRMSDESGDLVRLGQTAFPSLPQLVTETQNYVTGFALDHVRERVLAKRSELGRDDVRVVAARVKLASGREVVADARHVKELAF